MALMNREDVAEYLGVSPKGRRVNNWLAEHGIVPVEDFGPGRQGGKRYRDVDIYAVHERRVQAAEEAQRAAAPSKPGLTDMSWKDAQKALADKKAAKKKES